MSRKILFQSSSPEYNWLSNFFLAPFTLDGKEYPTVEHYFQSQKYITTRPAYAEEVRAKPTPSQARTAGRNLQVPIRGDWEDVKIELMKTALQAKFEQNPELQDKLCNTEGHVLVHEASWDNYWGTGSTGKGTNLLGILLMQIRDMMILQRVHDAERQQLQTKVRDLLVIVRELQENNREVRDAAQNFKQRVQSMVAKKQQQQA